VILLYTVPFVDQLTSSFKYKMNFLTCDLLLHTHSLFQAQAPKSVEILHFKTLRSKCHFSVGSYFKEFLLNAITTCILNMFLFTYSTQLLYKIYVCDICNSLISFPFFLPLKNKQGLNFCEPHAT